MAINTPTTKIEFILELLKGKYFEGSERDRFMGLVLQEINEMEQPTQKKDAKNTTNMEVGRNKYIDPRNTSLFLKKFNQNIILKSTTHRIDQDLLNDLLKELSINSYEYFKHIEGIRREFNALSEEIGYIHRGLYAKLKKYLFNEGEGWSSLSIQEGWSSPGVVSWCEQNKGKCPNPDTDLGYNEYEFDLISDTSESMVFGSFNGIISHFKKSIEFRDERDIKTSIEAINIQHFEKYQFDTSQMKSGIRFYSDVEKVKQAYKKIIKMSISAHSDKSRPPLFTVELHEQSISNEECVVLRVTHGNNVFGITIESLIDRYGKDFSQIIKNQINGLCDLRLSAFFPNDTYGAGMVWPKTNNGSEWVQENKQGEGVTFELIFYRVP